MPFADHEFRELVVEKLAVLDETTKNTLIQATKTNGRVTVLEHRANENDTLRALDSAEKKRIVWWREVFIKALIPIFCTGFGFTALLVLQKTGIVDISVITCHHC